MDVGDTRLLFTVLLLSFVGKRIADETNTRNIFVLRRILLHRAIQGYGCPSGEKLMIHVRVDVVDRTNSETQAATCRHYQDEIERKRLTTLCR